MGLEEMIEDLNTALQVDCEDSEEGERRLTTIIEKYDMGLQIRDANHLRTIISRGRIVPLEAEIPMHERESTIVSIMCNFVICKSCC